MSYDKKRVDRLRRLAMTLMHNADTNFGNEISTPPMISTLPIEHKILLYARAAAYLALERNEQASGQVSVNQTVDTYFDQIGEDL